MRICIRNKSTASKLPPKLAYVPNKYNSKSSAFNLKPAMDDGLFYQPAPSPMDPETTPRAFLPDSDPRKKSEVYYPEDDKMVKQNLKYMPIIYQSRQAKLYNMTKKDVLELQKMRDSGATRKQMKEKFKVSDFFISIATNPKPRKLVDESKALHKQSKRWSVKTRNARVLKEKKKQLWERGL